MRNRSMALCVKAGRMSVTRAYRNRGIGTALVKRAETVAIKIRRERSLFVILFYCK